MHKLIVLILLLIATVAYAIDRTERSLIYFGRQSSARSEAMGRGMVAVADGVFSATQNPALITAIEGVEAVYSHSSPYYMSEDAKYDNFGIGCTLDNIISAAFSTRQFAENLEYTTTNEEGIELGKSSGGKLRDYNFSLAGKYPILEKTDISAGFNCGYIWDEYDGEGQTISYNKLTLDLGLNINHQLSDDAKINLAASLSNITKTVYEEIDAIDIPDWELPQVVRIGICAEMITDQPEHSYSNLIFLKTILTCQYQDVLNDKVRDGFSLGSEFQFMEILNLRAGYYKERINEPNDYGNKEWFKELTYGFGINLPIAKQTNHKIPLNISLDLTKLPQPSYNEYGSNPFTGEKWDDFTSVAVKANYLL